MSQYRKAIFAAKTCYLLLVHRQSVDKKEPLIEWMRYYIRYCQEIGNPSDKSRINQALIHLAMSQDGSVRTLRTELIRKLAQNGYFAHFNTLYQLVAQAIQTKDYNVLYHLFSMKSLISKRYLYKLSVYIAGYLQWHDSFRLLDPSDYKDTYWRKLTTYEKLYFLVMEHYQQKMLAHRIGLVGDMQPRWRGFELSHYQLNQSFKLKIPLEGHYLKDSFFALKQSLIRFVGHYEGGFKESFQKALNTFLQLDKPSDCLRYSYGGKRAHIYIFDADEHVFAAYHTRQGYYMSVNMGLGSKRFPGVKLYRVDSLSDWYLFETLQNFARNPSVKDFNHIPKHCGLEAIGYFALPNQMNGSCSYDSPRGLFFALLLTQMSSQMPLKHAYDFSLMLYLDFLSFDFNQACTHYERYSLSPSQPLLDRARSILPHYQQINLDREEGYFCKIKPGKEGDSRLRVTPI